MAFYFVLAIGFLVSGIVKAFYEVWLRPQLIRRMMSRQGVHGPPYNLLHGNNREVSRMKELAAGQPINNLSHDLLPKVLPHVAKWTAAYGKDYLSWLGMEAQLVVANPAQVKELLDNKDRVFFKLPPESFIKKVLGGGLVASEGDKWAKMRKIANHAFHGKSLKGMVQDMVDSTHMMLERWKDHQGKEIEVFEEFKELTSEVISRTAFGSSYMEGRTIFDMLTRLAMLAAKNALTTRIPGIRKILRTPDQEEADRLELALRSAILQIIEKRESYFRTGELDGYGNDFLGLLIKALHDQDDQNRITVDDLIDECKTRKQEGRCLMWLGIKIQMQTAFQGLRR
ncbi:hypothetical protein MLD38_017009 [Melastoma candidum]|uniref:Uncharacterized protein n=1 Tax=Melastoma candidum TaxID=119954 RepID=A0ACB9QQF1_9MYRT|nr:hypothetical protein MLD38_017009 [Melastoma candidum]